VTSGGGGYGPPAEREPSRVLADVRAGYVSVEEARDTYQVAIAHGPNDYDFILDSSATAAMRRERPTLKGGT
jgi:N-methylhydantoinase B/oxoprolinase/acetone carboxylase alpha subunit